MDPLGYLRSHPSEWRQTLRVVIAVAVTLLAIDLLDLPGLLGGHHRGHRCPDEPRRLARRRLSTAMGNARRRSGRGAASPFSCPIRRAIEVALAIILATIPLAYLAAVNPAFRVAPVTAVIMLVPTYGHAADPMTTRPDRVFEIALGNVVALAVAILVLPVRANEQLRAEAAKVVTSNAELMDALIDGMLSGTGRQGIQPIHARIRANIKQAEVAADETSRERRMRFSDASDPEPVVRTL